MKTVTLDTNVFPNGELVARAQRLGFEVTVISVTRREVEGSSLEEEVAALKNVPELALWGEARWGMAQWPSAASAGQLEQALNVLSSGSFPPLGSRGALKPGELRQLRDALILASHVCAKRDVLVTNDRKAYVNHGRREAIERVFATTVLTVEEFEAALEALEPRTR